MAQQGVTQSLPTGLSELKNRILFVLFGILIFRLGAHIPVPGINPSRLAEFFQTQQNTVLGLVNMFSGGALERFTVFALGIMPYISASIVIQLLTAVVPTLEQMKKEGEQGKRKITQITRYATLFLAAAQAIGFARFLESNGVAIYSGIPFYFTVVLTLVTGTMLLMWVGEQITDKGVGNGISIIIFAGIVAGLPLAGGNMVEQVREGSLIPIALIIILIAVILITAFIVFVERGQRRIVVNYARRQQGRKVYAAQKSHLPLKVNMAGVIPPIFASSIILFPATISQFFGSPDGSGILDRVALALSPGQPLYILFLAFGIIFFAFFYSAIVFNPRDTADNLKKSGAYLVGIRPGEQTAKYIDGVMTRLTLVGGLYIAFVALLPEVLVYGWQVPVYFGGTSLLIVVVVVMDFVAQVQTHLMSSQYDKLLKKRQGGVRGGSGLF